VTHFLATLLAQVQPYTANIDLTQTGGLVFFLTVHWHTWRQTQALKTHAEQVVTGLVGKAVKRHETKHHGVPDDDAS
jgi:hypothetical protein